MYLACKNLHKVGFLFPHIERLNVLRNSTKKTDCNLACSQPSDRGHRLDLDDAPETTWNENFKATTCIMKAGWDLG